MTSDEKPKGRATITFGGMTEYDVLSINDSSCGFTINSAEDQLDSGIDGTIEMQLDYEPIDCPLEITMPDGGVIHAAVSSISMPDEDGIVTLNCTADEEEIEWYRKKDDESAEEKA